MPLANGYVQSDAITVGRQVYDIRHLPVIVIKDLPQMSTETNHRLRGLHMPMDRQRRPRLDGIEHPLGLVGRGVAQVQIHPQPRRRLRLGGQRVKYVLVDNHIFLIPSIALIINDKQAPRKAPEVFRIRSINSKKPT